MIKIGLIGASGYSGLTALEILLKHPEVRLTYISANNTKGAISDIWPHLKGLSDLVCDAFDLNKAIEAADFFILAVPHTISMNLAPQLLSKGKRVIDLSGDYRLANPNEYKQWYGTDHIDTTNLTKAVYGLPEIYREDIKKAKLISNPGCYPTAALIGLAPLAALSYESINSIIIDAKSGVSGAGRKAHLSFSFAEVNENFKAYKVLNHQHAPEINQYLSKIAGKQLSAEFVPHLLPINRGILETIYVRFNKQVSLTDLHTQYKKFYKTEPFVRVCDLGKQPELRDVVYTNFCDLALSINKENNLLAVTSVIDNLLKGASGQAVQNLNIMCGFKEETGLPKIK